MSRETAKLLILWSVFVAGCASLGPLSPLRPVERSLLFHPVAWPDGERAPDGLTPEDAWFTAADGTRLHGWYVDHPEPRGVALLCHGNAGNISGLAETLQILNQRHGLAVLAFDYRGYGRSEGKPSEAGILQDARAARTWLARRVDVAESDVTLMGVSLGGGVAVDLAQDGARGLVLASTFTSLPAAAKHHFSWLPTGSMMTFRMNSLEKIRNYPGPVLISHGDEDEVIPFEHGQQLYAAAAGEKVFFRVPGGRHNDPQPEEYRVAFDAFLDRLPPMRGR